MARRTDAWRSYAAGTEAQHFAVFAREYPISPKTAGRAAAQA